MDARRIRAFGMWLSALQLLFLVQIAVLDRVFSANVRLPGVTPTKPNCQYPIVRNGSAEIRDNIVDLHRHAADVWFDAILRLQMKKPCKFKCINGEWVGPLCQTKDGDKKYYPVYKSCSTNIFRNFIVSHANKTILGNREFVHNTGVQVRCREFGMYKLIGDSRVNCHNGHWKPRVPSCIPTSFLNNFTDDSSPPTVQVRITAGSASIEPSGELAVYPGSVIHLECLHARKQGEPEWSWTSTYRTYPTGWSIAPDERGWKYRLSIYYVKPQDTGIYTCATPKGLTHSIILNVIAVHCNAAKVLSTDSHLLIHVEGSRLGQAMQFSCSEGFKLVGVSNATCQASGIWSGDPPRCLPIICPELAVPENGSLKLIKQEVNYGGRAVFECPSSHKMQGSSVLICDRDEQWSATVPHCKETFCAPPLIPQNGKLEFTNDSASFPFRVGSIVTFSCKGAYQLIGEDRLLCTDAGYWSNPPPFCKAKCSHPGDAPNGQYIPKKQQYDVGERVVLLCNDGYEATSKAKPRCLKNGHWSELGMECKVNRQRMKILLAREGQMASTPPPVVTVASEQHFMVTLPATATIPATDRTD